jgi:hypothetical protein
MLKIQHTTNMTRLVLTPRQRGPQVYSLPECPLQEEGRERLDISYKGVVGINSPDL